MAKKIFLEWALIVIKAFVSASQCKQCRFMSS